MGPRWASFTDEVLNVLRNEASYKETIHKLETELSVYKRAFADVDSELKAAQLAQLETETLNARLEKEYLSFKKQDKVQHCSPGSLCFLYS